MCASTSEREKSVHAPCVHRGPRAEGTRLDHRYDFFTDRSFLFLPHPLYLLGCLYSFRPLLSSFTAAHTVRGKGKQPNAKRDASISVDPAISFNFLDRGRKEIGNEEKIFRVAKSSFFLNREGPPSVGFVSVFGFRVRCRSWLPGRRRGGPLRGSCLGCCCWPTRLSMSCRRPIGIGRFVRRHDIQFLSTRPVPPSLVLVIQGSQTFNVSLE